MKRLIKSLAIKLLSWGLNYLYNYIDSDKDGKLSKEELEKVYKKFKDLMKKIRNRK